ncbi:MAG: ribose 5-phosphate isomerase B [Myxococcota bacterium]|nr:ribose 5-phosphate isomerase B [Myxococcota bacterium]
MRIVVGSDHAGLKLKTELVSYLKTLDGVELSDLGTHTADSCDYPDYARPVALAVANGEADWGLLVCGTGVGMSMAANKVAGVRAAVISDTFSAAATRQHNDANVLCIGERVVGGGLALAIVKAWIATEFEGGRHQRRVNKISALEHA